MDEVTMFDCGFGDCFKIEYGVQKEDILYVDYGIHKDSKVRKKSFAFKLINEEIVNQLTVKKNNSIDFMFTHFHEDHFNGFLKLVSSKEYKAINKKFRYIYLPDFFDTKITSIVLLGSVEKKKSKLFKLLMESINNCYEIKLVTRGSVINRHFTALWPEKTEIQKSIDEIVTNADAKILEISEKLNECILTMLQVKSDDNKREVLGTLSELETQFNIVLDNGREISSIRKAKEIGNDVSIVFHTSNNSKGNILMTGDIPNRYLKWIAEAKDYALHSNYRIVKIPHHGTKAYYYDFISYTPERCYISNGDIIKPSLGIDGRYRTHMKKTVTICSNLNACFSCAKHPCLSCRHYHSL